MRILFKGLLFGLGLGVGLSFVFITVLFFLNEIDPWAIEGDISDSGAVVINDHRLELRESGPVVYGTIQNTTGQELSSVAVEASFFNEMNTFIERSVDYFSKMEPGDFDGFKISCYDWDDSIPYEELSYKVRISQAFFAE